MAAFFIVKMFKTRQNWRQVFDHCASYCATYFLSKSAGRYIVKLDQIEHFGLSNKAAVVSNFCLFGKNNYNFLVPRMIELGCQTFMPIQTLDLHRVYQKELEYRLNFRLSKFDRSVKPISYFLGVYIAWFFIQKLLEFVRS